VRVALQLPLQTWTPVFPANTGHFRRRDATVGARRDSIRELHYLPEHMFPRATAKRIRSALADAAETMLEVADAMLAPEPAFGASDGESTAPYAGASVAPVLQPAPHPHRQPLRSDRPRRPGRTLARDQHCISPVTRSTPPHTVPAAAPAPSHRAARS
jgi:hypothetical protein